MYPHHSKTNQSSSCRLFYKVRLAQNDTLNGPTVKKLCIFELFKYLKPINSTRRHLCSRRELSVPKILGSLPSYSRRKHPHATRNEKKLRLRGANTGTRRDLCVSQHLGILPTRSRRQPCARGANRRFQKPQPAENIILHIPNLPNSYQYEPREIECTNNTKNTS